MKLIVYTRVFQPNEIRKPFFTIPDNFAGFFTSPREMVKKCSLAHIVTSLSVRERLLKMSNELIILISLS
jgi:hypothetical protein